MEFIELIEIAPELEELSEADRKAIELFTLTWSIFESKKLDRNASIPKIEEKLAIVELEEKCWEPTLSYFKKRYFPDGIESSHFENLNIRSADVKERVENVLCGRSTDSREILLICLVIVYRYRNNLFHGEKWVYGVKGQQENFKVSVNLLRQCLKLFPDGI